MTCINYRESNLLPREIKLTEVPSFLGKKCLDSKVESAAQRVFDSPDLKHLIMCNAGYMTACTKLESVLTRKTGGFSSRFFNGSQFILEKAATNKLLAARALSSAGHEESLDSTIKLLKKVALECRTCKDGFFSSILEDLILSLKKFHKRNSKDNEIFTPIEDALNTFLEGFNTKMDYGPFASAVYVLQSIGKDSWKKHLTPENKKYLLAFDSLSCEPEYLSRTKHFYKITDKLAETYTNDELRSLALDPNHQVTYKDSAWTAWANAKLAESSLSALANAKLSDSPDKEEKWRRTGKKALDNLILFLGPGFPPSLTKFAIRLLSKLIMKFRQSNELKPFAVEVQNKLLTQLSNKNKKIDFVSAIELARVGDKNGLEHIIGTLKSGSWHTRQSLLDLTHNLKLWKSIKWENFDTQLKSNLISALNNILHLYPTRETFYTDEIELVNLTILALEKIGDSENIAEIKQYLKGIVQYESEKEANRPRLLNKYSLQEKLGNFSMEVLGRIGSSDEIKFLEDLQRDPVLKNDNMCSRKTEWEISINKALAMLYKKELDKLKLPNPKLPNPKGLDSFEIIENYDGTQKSTVT